MEIPRNEIQSKSHAIKMSDWTFNFGNPDFRDCTNSTTFLKLVNWELSVNWGNFESLEIKLLSEGMYLCLVWGI